jgi:NitT/TauT family transport system permease protein
MGVLYINPRRGPGHGVAWGLLAAVLALLATFARMAVALAVTVAVAYAVAYAMYRSRRVEAVALPVIDVLQSVPILGFFPLALYVFLALFPAVGAELAAVFLIFTSMAWNIILGVYQSFKTLPREYVEYVQLYLGEGLGVAHVYVPVALRSVYYNILISWANAFFFITASEVITLGTEIKLFGIGSFVVSAFERGDYSSAYIGIAVGILANLALYAFLLRRLVEEVPQPPASVLERFSAWVKYGLYAVLGGAALLLAGVAYYAFQTPPSAPLVEDLLRGFMHSVFSAPLTLTRVLAVLGVSAAIGLLVLAAVVKMPRLEVGVLVALSALSSVPAVFLYPLIASFVKGEILALALLFPGSVIYTVFNLLAARRDVPLEFVKAYGIGGLTYYLHVLIPAALPYLVTGLLTAWGGAWNASVVAEPLADVAGLGTYMDTATTRGDVAGLLASVTVMTLIVVAVNKTVWQRLYDVAARWRS